MIWILNEGRHQCDRIGQILKVVGYNFSYKSSPNIHQLKKAPLKHITFWVCIPTEITFWATFGNIWATFLFQQMITLVTRHKWHITYFSFVTIFSQMLAHFLGNSKILFGQFRKYFFGQFRNAYGYKLTMLYVLFGWLKKGIFYVNIWSHWSIRFLL